MESEDLPLYILTVKCLGFSRMKESIRPDRWNTIFNERRQEAFEHSTKGCIFERKYIDEERVVLGLLSATDL